MRLPGASQTNTITFRSNKFGSANFHWLREINFDSISAKLFVDSEAKYPQTIRALFDGEQHGTGHERAVSILGQNPDSIMKMIVNNSNEYDQVLCAVRVFLTRYRHPSNVIETPLHFIFCHLFGLQSNFRKVETREKCGAVHDLYFCLDRDDN